MHLCSPRTTAFFVTPSSVWPSDAEEKKAIVEGYKQKLSSMDCKWFDQGDGTCPCESSAALLPPLLHCTFPHA